MKVSCACSVDLASPDLVEKLIGLGVEPIVTSQVIRAVYEGNRKTGERIVDIFGREPDHDIYYSYDKSEQDKPTRRAIRKQKKRR